MNWYYANGGRQDGPHSDEAIRELVASGAIAPSTLVWREGMASWQPISEAAPELVSVAGPAAPPAVSVSEAVCVECGSVLPAAEMVFLAGSPVCARCKPLRLQKLQEGVATSGRSADLARLLRVAKAQRGVNVAILLSFACYGLVMLGGVMAPAGGRGAPPAASALSFIGLIGLLVVLVLQIIYVYRLAAALESGVPIVWVLGVACLSCIGLLLLLVLSSKATKQLRAAGFKVGLMGGNPKDVEKAMLGG